MYEKVFNNIIIAILCVLLLFSTIGFYTSQKRVRRLEQRLNDLRTELSDAQDRERELTETVDNIRGITTRTDQILSQSTGTIQSIREKISILEEYFDSIHQYFSTSNNDNDSNPDSEE
jgi:type II secretory pathway pseudopilin PulG